MEEKRLWLDCVVVACFWCPEMSLKCIYLYYYGFPGFSMVCCKIISSLNLANGEDMNSAVVARHTQQRAVAVEVHAVNSRGLKIKYFTI